MDDKSSIEPDDDLDRLLDRVEHGEEVTISRNGMPVARLVPSGSERDLKAAREAVRRMDKLRQNISLGDGLTFKDLIHEGHKF